MIVGTAGHIDHGKTSLLKALTGTDADRLPEEKARGITVDLGFAYQHFADSPSISFLDVPGHEKLVHNMLAGAIGIDFVMLVVAADDGVMPQTREHMAVIDLLGIGRGLVALTKIDRVDAARCAEVAAQIRGLTAGTALGEAPIMPCSAVTGEGIGDLSRHLALCAKATRPRASQGHFRLAVDRCFALAGIGLIVTGTVYAGTVKVGDTLMHSPKGTEVRVRGIRAENREEDSAFAGQRCALNLTGRRLEKEQVSRGDWILASEVHAPSQRLDVRLRLLSQEQQSLKHWTPVHVHLAASDVSGRVALVEDKALEPGATTLAQLILDAPTGALFGDRLIIRDQSALRTLGGGHVIDPLPPRRGARRPQRLRTVALMDCDSPADALSALLGGERDGIDLDAFCLTRNLTAAEATALCKASGVIEVRCGQRLGLSAAAWQSLQTEVVAHLADYQRANADSPGATTHELVACFKEPRRRLLAREAVTALIEKGDVQRFGQLLHLQGHEVQLSDSEEVLWRRIENALRTAAYDQPRVTTLAETLALPLETLTPLLSKLGRIGRLRRVSKAYFMLPEILAKLAGEATQSALSHPEQLLTVGRFRVATGVSRHMVMPLMEFFDRIGFTRRIKDGRQIRAAWAA